MFVRKTLVYIFSSCIFMFFFIGASLIGILSEMKTENSLKEELLYEGVHYFQPSILLFIGLTSLVVFSINLIYGLPISILSDKLTERFFGKKRILLAFIVHLIFGAFFVVIYGKIYLVNFMPPTVIFTISLIISSLFWGIDEIVRSIQKKITEKNVAAL